MKPVYKVILMNGMGEQGKWILRQTPNREGISQCGKYQFYVNEEIPNPDFVVIRGKSLKRPFTFHVAPENVVLTTSEPYSILSYPKGYCKQFGLVCSCQEQLKHPHIIYTPALLPWYIGATFDHGTGIPQMDYDDFKQLGIPKEKQKLMSVITSNKAFTQGHQDRIDFVEKLKAHYGDQLDVFGKGFRDFEDKWEVLAPYKYHIAIENSSSKYYWTEKLSDCYLAGTFPIYYGCRNIHDYFPQESLVCIDIRDVSGSIATIDKLIANENHFNTCRPTLEQCQKLILEDYNIFNYIAVCLDKLNPNLPKSEVTIHPAKTMHDWHNIYLNVVGRNAFKLKNAMKTFMKGESSLHANKNKK